MIRLLIGAIAASLLAAAAVVLVSLWQIPKYEATAEIRVGQKSTTETSQEHALTAQQRVEGFGESVRAAVLRYARHK